jgi:predicted DNA-binding transcriptional regulator YafY
MLTMAKPTVAMDVVAACLVSSLRSTLRDTSIKPYLEKLRDAVVAQSSDFHEAADLDRKFWFVARGGERAFPRETDAFLQIAEALLCSRTISFRYTGFRGETKQLMNVRPLTMALHEHQFYVIAIHKDGGLHPYRFARMSKVRRGAKFDYPSPDVYDPSLAFRDAFGIHVASRAPVEDVRLRLRSFWRPYVESHRWHESQVNTPNADGTVDVHIRVRVCEEVRRWALWFGSDAVVLEPASLRSEIARQLQGAASRYEPQRPTVAAARKRGPGARPKDVRKARAPSALSASATSARAVRGKGAQ